MISGDIFGQKTGTFQSLCIDVTILMTKNPTNKVVVEGHYFTLLAIITYFRFDHGKILDIFLTLLKGFR